MRILATCHTMVRDDSDTLQGESPDELALLMGMETLGCRVNSRTTKTIEIEWNITGNNNNNT